MSGFEANLQTSMHFNKNPAHLNDKKMKSLVYTNLFQTNNSTHPVLFVCLFVCSEVVVSMHLILIFCCFFFSRATDTWERVDFCDQPVEADPPFEGGGHFLG